MFKVECQVWGGVTGHRRGFLKSDGVEREFATLEDAQKEAAGLMNAVSMLRTADRLASGAQFSYRAVEV